MNQNKVFIIFGATASGKSNLAIKLANKINGVIINADSSQIYKEFPILSNIPNQKEQNNLPHKLFSIKSILDNFTLIDWLNLVKTEIESAFANKKTPIVVGGTGLYLNALINGISDIPSDEEKKRESQDLYNKLGYDNFFEKIKKIDPIFTEKIKDPHRLIRMYEVFLITNKSILELQKNKKQLIEVQFANFFINTSKENLYNKINSRFKEMLENGAIEEVKLFINSNPKHTQKLTKILGAMPIYDFLNNKINYEDTLSIGSQATRHYAKRQLTWYRGNFLHNFKVINL
jgi:tRNA dimethylallyltransferase